MELHPYCPLVDIQASYLSSLLELDVVLFVTSKSGTHRSYKGGNRRVGRDGQETVSPQVKMNSEPGGPSSREGGAAIRGGAA